MGESLEDLDLKVKGNIKLSLILNLSVIILIVAKSRCQKLEMLR
jgi:hypothetical protein